MDALEFIRERNRMCKSFGVCCNNCPADKNTACDSFAWKEELVTIVEKWSKENPRKTRQSVFLEQYPNAKCVDGILVFCPRWIDTCFSCVIDGNNNVDCATCMYEFWMQEVE